MPKTADDITTGLLSTVFKLDEAGVAELKESDGTFKDDALDTLTKKHAEHIAKVKGDVDTLKRERYSQGKREALEGLETELREEFGYNDATKKGKDLIKDLIALQLQAASKTDEAKIKASPLYRDLEKKLADEQAGVTEKLTAKEKEVEARFQGEQNIRTVLDEAEVLFNAWKPVLPSDVEKAANVKRDFLEKLRSGKFQVTRKEDGKVDILPMEDDGKTRRQDDLGHALTLKALVEDMASKRFDQVASEAKNGAADPNKVGAASGGGGSGNYPPKMTAKEYAEAHAKNELLPKEERVAGRLKLKAVLIEG